LPQRAYVEGRKKGLLFVNKKKKKTLIYWRRWHHHCHNPHLTKVFWFFFSKKNCFLAFKYLI